MTYEAELALEVCHSKEARTPSQTPACAIDISATGAEVATRKQKACGGAESGEVRMLTGMVYWPFPWLTGVPRERAAVTAVCATSGVASSVARRIAAAGAAAWTRALMRM